VTGVDSARPSHKLIDTRKVRCPTCKRLERGLCVHVRNHLALRVSGLRQRAAGSFDVAVIRAAQPPNIQAVCRTP
jgi:hypothetical protein